MGDSTFHSELSPSKRHRWAACPGSIREEARYPEPPDSPAAIDGTRTHALLERCIKFEFIDKEGQCGPAPCFGLEVTDEYGTYKVDAERAARVAVALDYIREKCKPGWIPKAEQRVYPDGLVLRADMSGTVDCQIPGDVEYEIIDYKDGMGIVEAENNPQLDQYAIGVLAGLDPIQRPQRFRLTIIQPKLALKGMPAISSCVISTQDLLARVEVIKAQAAATDDPDAPLVPGEAQCKYCRAKGNCPALTGKVMSEVGMMFGPVVGADVAQQAANKDPGQMGDAELRQILEAAPLVRQLLDGCENEVKRRLESGKAVPGFKLVRGKGSRDWSLTEDEMIKKLGPGGMGIPKSVLLPTKLLSVAQVEKVSWTDKEGNVQKLSDRQIKRMQTEYVTQHAGKPVVVPESDPRPAITTDASSMFGAIDVQANAVPSFLGGASAPVPAFLQAPSWMK